MSFCEIYKKKFYDKLGPRKDTYYEIFKYLELLNLNFYEILETGCSRSTDNFSGDGMSSYLFDQFVNFYDGKVTSVDINPENCKVAQSIVSHKTNVICDNSLHYLEMNNFNPDFVYLDSYDFEINNPHPSAYHHIREFLKLVCKLKKQCLIVVDDNYLNSGKGIYIRNLFNFIEVDPYFDSYHLGYIWKPEYLEKIKVIVSFTTIPPRINNLKQKINNIIWNTYNNLHIELNVSKEYKRFKENIDFSLLEDIKNKEPKFNYYITEDLGPYSKIFPTWERYNNKKQLIYFMDDDTCYPMDTIEIFLANYFTKNENKNCFCGFTDIITRNPEGFVEKHNNKRVSDRKQPYVYLSFDYNKSTDISMRANFIYGHGGCLFLSKDVNLTKMPSDCPEFYFNDDVWITYQFYTQNVDIFCCPYISTNKYNLSDKGSLHGLPECGKTWNICLDYCRRNGNLFN